MIWKHSKPAYSTAIFFLEKSDEPEECPEMHYLPQVPGKKIWRPLTSKHPELELFLSNVRKDLLTLSNIRKAKDNLSSKECQIKHRINPHSSRLYLNLFLLREEISMLPCKPSLDCSGGNTTLKESVKFLEDLLIQ